MKKRKLVRGGVFGHTFLEFYKHEGAWVAWYWGDHWEEDDSYDYYQDSGNLPCGCCSCCGCDCYRYEEDEE